MTRIRVEADGSVGQDTKVTHIADDGAETDISTCITGLDMTIRAGEIPRVTCHALLAMPTVFEGELEHMVLDVIPPEMIPDVVRQLTQRVGVTTIDRHIDEVKSGDDALVVYNHWRKERGKTRGNYDRFSGARRQKIEARLKEFSVEELCQAISNVANDPWEERPNFDDITVIFHNRERTERFLEMEPLASNGNRRYGYGMTTSEIVNAADAIEDGEFEPIGELNAGS